MDNDTIEGVVQTQIESPRVIEKGAQNYDRVYMPAEIVTGQDAEDVATYVASVAGVPGAKPPQLGAGRPVRAEVRHLPHARQAAGTTATVGPNLDEVLAGKDAAFIEKSIVDPNAEITPGFQPNVMPQTFGQRPLAAGPQGPRRLPPAERRLGLRRRRRRGLAPTRTAPARRSRPPGRRPRA